jgi:hypothetical protein
VGSTQPSIQWVSGSLSPEIKRPGREADQTGAKRKNVSSKLIAVDIRMVLDSLNGCEMTYKPGKYHFYFGFEVLRF